MVMKGRCLVPLANNLQLKKLRELYMSISLSGMTGSMLMSGITAKIVGHWRLWAILPVRAELHTKRSLSLRRISGPLRKRRQMNISYNVLDIKKKVVFISV